MIDALADYIDSQAGILAGPESRRIVLCLLRRLAGGAAVETTDLAEALALPDRRVRDVLAGIPAAWIERTDTGGITGLGGLGLAPTRHRVVADGRTLYAWCAFDSMFLAGLLGQAVDVESTCPASHDVIRLAVTPERVLRATPSTTVMSFVTPGAEARRTDLRRVFCDRVNFFASENAASAWLSANADAVMLTLDEAHALGRRRNAAVFAEALSA